MIVGKADVYPETVWKAFSLGAAMTALGVAIGELLRPVSAWNSSWEAFTAALVILGVGACCAALCVYWPAFARLFLRESRASLEVSQYARTQFLERELFATPSRTAILMLVSLLERRVVILADSGLRAHVSAAEWDAVIAGMTPKLRNGEVAAAVLAGLDAIGALLAGKTFAHGAGNAFPDKPIEEQGA